MKSFSSRLALSALAAAASVAATEWHFVTYYPPSGGQFTGITGSMVVPPIPEAATYYLWPGVQPTDNSGVFQNVLDGRSGTWWWGTGWCCSNPSLPWGGGGNVSPGQSVWFNNYVDGDSGNWIGETGVHPNVDATATNSFAIAYKDFNQAIFAIELDDVSWNFGPLTFWDVTITATGTDTSWCTAWPANYNSATQLNITGVSATVVGDTVQCYIEQLELVAPQ